MNSWVMWINERGDIMDSYQLEDESSPRDAWTIAYDYFEGQHFHENAVRVLFVRIGEIAQDISQRVAHEWLALALDRMGMQELEEFKDNIPLIIQKFIPDAASQIQDEIQEALDFHASQKEKSEYFKSFNR